MIQHLHGVSFIELKAFTATASALFSSPALPIIVLVCYLCSASAQSHANALQPSVDPT